MIQISRTEKLFIRIFHFCMNVSRKINSFIKKLNYSNVFHSTHFFQRNVLVIFTVQILLPLVYAQHGQKYFCLRNQFCSVYFYIIPKKRFSFIYLMSKCLHLQHLLDKEDFGYTRFRQFSLSNKI